MRISQIILAGLVLIGCAPSETNNNTIQVNDNTDPAPYSVISRTTLENTCLNGGVSIDVGFDDNGNGILDSNEISETYTICNGEDGLNVSNYIVNINDEAAGANCTYGGLRLEAGYDQDQNGLLEGDAEIDELAYFCNKYNQIIHSYQCQFDLLVGDNSTNIRVNYRIDEFRNGELDVYGEVITSLLGVSKNNRWTPFMASQKNQWNLASVKINFDVLTSAASGYSANGGYWVLTINRNNTSGFIDIDVNGTIQTVLDPSLDPSQTNIDITYVDTDLDAGSVSWPDTPVTFTDCMTN